LTVTDIFGHATQFCSWNHEVRRQESVIHLPLQIWWIGNIDVEGAWEQVDSKVASKHIFVFFDEATESTGGSLLIHR